METQVEELENQSEELTTKTLKEIGNTLPIPVKGNHLEFEFRPWRMAEEKKIGEIKAKSQNNLGKMVREIFDFMIVSMGGTEWKDRKEAERKLFLNQLPWGNVFYMYVYLRYEALGEEIRMQEMQCPNCSGSIKNYIGDIGTMEVRDKKVTDKEFSVYELIKPVLVGDVKIKALKVGYTPWDVMEKIKSANKNEGSIKEAMITKSIEGAYTEEQGEAQIAVPLILKELTKRDIERMYTILDEHNGGPVLGLDVECPSCGHEFDAAINWTYDYFFGNSSLPGN